jgi:hypothetical protein
VLPTQKIGKVTANIGFMRSRLNAAGNQSALASLELLTGDFMRAGQLAQQRRSEPPATIHYPHAAAGGESR